MVQAGVPGCYVVENRLKNVALASNYWVAVTMLSLLMISLPHSRLRQ